MPLIMTAKPLSAPALLCERSSLGLDAIWIFTGNAVYAGGQWFMLVLLAKLTQPELVGQYALGLAIALPVFTLASLQLRLVLVSDVKEETHFGHFLTLRVLSTAIALMIIFATTRLLGYHWQLSAVILMVGVAQAFEAISDVYYGRLQKHNGLALVSKSMIARTVLSALGLTLGVYFTGDLLLGIVGVVLARAIVLFAYDLRERTHRVTESRNSFYRSETLGPRWDLAVQRRLLWLTLPIGIALVLASLNSTIPRYFIERHLGERDLGIFSAIAFMLAVGSMVVVSVGHSAFTRLSRLYANADFFAFRSLLAKLLLLGAGMGVGGLIVARVAGHEILMILFRPEYADRADLLPWIMTVGCVGYMAQFLGYGMTAGKYYYSQILLFSLTNLSVAMACSLLIPRHGLRGAIFAMLISTIVQLAGSVIILLFGMRRHAAVLAPGDWRNGVIP